MHEDVAAGSCQLAADGQTYALRTGGDQRAFPLEFHARHYEPGFATNQSGQQVWIAVGMGQGALVIPFSSGNHPAVIERPGDRSDTGPLMIGRRQDHRVSADWIP